MNVSEHTQENFIPLVLAPEAASDNFIIKVGQLLVKNGFYLRSGTILKGKRELVDLLYKSGPTNKSNRIEKLSKTFASYWQYAELPFAVLLLEDLRSGDLVTSHTRLNQLKGPSGVPEPGSLRGLSPLTRHMFSYIHVPDEEIVAEVIRWTLPTVQHMGPIDVERQHDHWSMIQEMMTFSHDLKVENDEDLYRQICRQALRMLLLSNIDFVLEQFPSEVRYALLRKEEGSYLNLQQIKSTMEKLSALIRPVDEAHRRLRLLMDSFSLILDPERRTIVNATSLSDLLDEVGLVLPRKKFQMLISGFLSIR